MILLWRTCELCRANETYQYQRFKATVLADQGMTSLGILLNAIRTRFELETTQ